MTLSEEQQNKLIEMLGDASDEAIEAYINSLPPEQQDEASKFLLNSLVHPSSKPDDQPTD